MKARRNIGHRSKRSETGMQLLELIFAVGISGFLTAILGSAIGELIRQSSTTQNQLVASTIAQETLDRLRSTRFDDLPSTGTFAINIDQSSVPSGSGIVLDRPLMIDAQHLNWTGAPAIGKYPSNHFRGSATVQIQPFTDPDGLDDDSKFVDIHVSWSDSSGSGHKLHRRAVIHRFGIARNAF